MNKAIFSSVKKMSCGEQVWRSGHSWGFCALENTGLSSLFSSFYSHRFTGSTFPLHFSYLPTFKQITHFSKLIQLTNMLSVLSSCSSPFYLVVHSNVDVDFNLNGLFVVI